MRSTIVFAFALLVVATIKVVNAGPRRHRSTAPSTPNITPSSVVADCSSSRNTGQTGRMSTKLTCTELYNWALYMVNNTAACTVHAANTTYEGNCVSSNGTLINSLYIEFVYGSYRVVASNGVPYHTYNSGAASSTPGYPCEYYTVMMLPTTVTKASNYSSTSMGQVGILNTGAYIYNPMSAETYCNAAGIEEADTFDTCNGHHDSTGCYHYHMQPASSCAYSTECTLAGYLYDGVPIYSQCSGYTSCYHKVNSGKTITVFNGCSTTDYSYSSTNYAAGTCNLDAANGITVNGTYRYYMTSTYPFVMYYYYGSKRGYTCIINPN